MKLNYRYLLTFCLGTIFQLASQNSMGQTQIELNVPGLKKPVEILRDKWGVNHIYAENQYDLFFAQGYSAAKDRLFQFEKWRRQATGTVAEILGPSELRRDIGTRLFKYRGDMKKELSHYHNDGIEIINAYVDGINARVEEVLTNSDLLPLEFKLMNLKPGRWTAEVVISRHQGLKGNINEELNFARAVAKAGAEKVKELVWFHPKEPDLNLDPSITSEMLSENILGLYNASQKALVFRKESTSPTAYNETPAPTGHGMEGSNNWVISGSGTESGFPYFASDPHRAITSPSLRYMVHLSAPGWNVQGGGEPVIPGVSIGHNDHGAWGLTIFETDAEDLFVYDLNPENLMHYKYKGKWKTMEKITETISVKDAPDTLVSLLYSIHGPVTFIDSARLKGYAVKCGWLETGGAPYLASLRMNQARNWKEFRKACTYNHLPGENMIWADTKGNIGWQVVGIVPERKNFSGMVPVPGDGRYEWKRYQKIKKRPHLLNPKRGFIATANQDVTPADYKHWETIGYTWADPYRGNRINEVLYTDSLRTLEKEKSLQSDYFSIPARTLVPYLKEVKFSNVLAEKAFHQLKDWNFILDKNSVEAGIYAMWERKLYAHANNKLIPEELKGLLTIQLSKLIGWLQNPDQRFGTVPESGRNEFIRETFEYAVNDLKSRFGNQISDWKYGQDNYKHITLNYTLHSLLSPDLQKKYTLGPLPRGGNSHTPNSTGGYDNQGSGASFRIIADVGDWDKTLMINSPGQSADPESYYYGNLFNLWANDAYFPAYFTKEKIISQTNERTILKPTKIISIL